MFSLFAIHLHYLAVNRYQLLFGEQGYDGIYNHVHDAKRYEPIGIGLEKRKFQTIKRLYVF
jgi:hypothetical protein